MKYKDFTARLTTRRGKIIMTNKCLGANMKPYRAIDMQGRAGGYVLIAEEWGLYLALLYTQAYSPLKQCTRKTACILFGRMLKKIKGAMKNDKH